MSYMCGNPLANATRMTWEGAATTAQTVIPVPGGYVPGMNDVYVGGACLSKGDYADADGLSITLAKAMALGTQWRIVCYAPTSGVSFSPNAYVAKIGDTMTGNLNFSGLGLRITGDLSNATYSQRLLFQTSTPNTASYIGVVPNGTGTGASVFCYGNPDPNNSGIVYLSHDGGNAVISSSKTGTAAYGPMLFNAGGLERMRIAANGRVQINTTADTGEQLQVNGFVRSASSNISTAVGVYRGLWYQTGNINRIGLGCTASPESGGNLGSDFSIDRYADNGNWLGTGLTIGRANGYVTIPGQVQVNSSLNVYGSGQLSSLLILQSGASYAPSIRSNNALPGWEFVNSAGTQVPLQVTDTGQLIALKGYYSGGATTALTSAAFRSTTQQGYSFADWINAPVALQIDCSDPASAYYAIKWTRWSDRHFAAISAIQNANNVSTLNFHLQGAGSLTWMFTQAQIARYDGYYCALNAPSDYRLKTNVQDLTGSLDRMLALRPVSFRWLESGKEADGFIAHEAQLVKPTAVTGTKDGMKLDEHDEEVPNYQSVDRLELIPDLVGAVRELKAALDAALTRIVVLEGGHLA